MKDGGGLDWIDGKQLSDLDFADDIVLLNSSWEGMQAMTQSLEEEARKFGLVITHQCNQNQDHDWENGTLQER